MDFDPTVLISDAFVGVQGFLAGSFLVSAIKFFLFIYTVVLLVDIVFLFILRGFSADLKAALFGTKRPLMTRSAAISRFEKILERLESGNPSQFKVAVLEADAMADGVLGEIGFSGATMGDKLESIKEGQLESRSDLLEAHAFRNRIVHEKDFEVSAEEAKQQLDLYKRFFDEVELF
jgi:hypothetical protein